MMIHAPKGPRNPQIRTDRSRSSNVPENVVFKTSHPHSVPGIAPPR
jgi:hypothetical protein